MPATANHHPHFRRLSDMARIAVLGALAGLIAIAAHPASARGPLLDPERGVLTVAPVIEQATPAVVNIAAEHHRAARKVNPLLRDPFSAASSGFPNNDARRAVSARP